MQIFRKGVASVTVQQQLGITWWVFSGPIGVNDFTGLRDKAHACTAPGVAVLADARNMVVLAPPLEYFQGVEPPPREMAILINEVQEYGVMVYIYASANLGISLAAFLCPQRACRWVMRRNQARVPASSGGFA